MDKAYGEIKMKWRNLVLLVAVILQITQMMIKSMHDAIYIEIVLLWAVLLIDTYKGKEW